MAAGTLFAAFVRRRPVAVIQASELTRLHLTVEEVAARLRVLEARQEVYHIEIDRRLLAVENGLQRLEDRVR